MLFISSKNISRSADERPFFFDLEKRCIACNLWKSQIYTKPLGNCSSRAVISAFPRWYVHKRKKWNCLPCHFVRGVHQDQFTTISFKHSLLPWLLMYKGEGFLSSSKSWFIFFVNDSVSGSVKEVAFGRLSLPLVYPMLLGRHRNTSLLKSPW